MYTIISADDGTLPVKSDEAKQAMLRQRKQFEMDSYYPYIRNHTYATEFVPISFEQAQALKLFLRGIDLEQEQYTKEHRSVMDLSARIESAMAQLKGTGDSDAFFVRMSTRSPKDASDKPVFREKLLDLMQRCFVDDGDGALNGEYLDLNRRLIRVRECLSKVLCVSRCADMLKLLSFSERCLSDLKRLIDHAHLLDSWDLSLVLRRFSFIPIANEFRCFVRDAKLTAISQYFPHCYFPNKVHAKAAQIRDMVQRYFGEVLLKECNELNTELESSYILDLNVDVDSGEIVIIELNPFARTTGAGVFDWVKDRELLYGEVPDADGSVYPAIRVRTEVDKHADAVLEQWAPIFTEFEKRVEDEQGDTCGCCVQ